MFSALIALAFDAGDLERAGELLDRAPLQGSCSVLYGRALRAFTEAVEGMPDFVPDVDSPRPFGFFDSPKAREARKLLTRAWEVCPWAIPFVTDFRVTMLRPLAIYALGTPFDALEFARLNFINWTAAGYPALWLASEFGGGEGMSKTVVRRLRRFHDEFIEAIGDYEDLEMPDLPEDDFAETVREFQDISDEIVGMMLDAGESPRGRRFRR